MDVDARGKQAIVIDYKYSAGGRMGDRIKAVEAGEAVQAGVYLLAAERAFGLQPAGMLYCHVKKGVVWDGWHNGIAGLTLGESRTKEAFAELARDAEQTVLRVHQEILAGRIDVKPADTGKCSWCECRDMCRIESIEAPKEMSA